MYIIGYLVKVTLKWKKVIIQKIRIRVLLDKTFGLHKKNDKLHTIMVALSETGKVLIKPIESAKNKVPQVKILGSNETIKRNQTDGGLQVGMPTKKPCDFAYVLEITM